MDLAKRAYDHGFRLDPIVRSLLDTDFYKLLMLQMIWREHRDVPVTFQVINRTKRVRLAEEIDIGVLAIIWTTPAPCVSPTRNWSGWRATASTA